MGEMNKSYYAIIPAIVRYDKTLTANAKLLYGEITALCNEKGYCWASNNYFAELYNCTPQAISKWINQLLKSGYVSVQMIKSGESIKERRIYLAVAINECLTGYQQKFQEVSTNDEGGYQQKFKENNTGINNIINNTDEEGETKRKRFIPPTHEEITQYCSENSCPININQFIDFYKSKDWKVGKNKMSDWQAAVRNWYRRDQEKVRNKSSTQSFDYNKQLEENQRLFGAVKK